MIELGDPAKTISCSNCKKDILQANFVIHELHCQRFIYLCSKCNEPVNCKQKDAHDKANHVVVFCKNCHVQMEKFLLREHLINDCPSRKLKCQICDIEVSATDIFEHENYCGARTEKCSECGEYIMYKYKQLHIDSNHTFIKLSDVNSGTSTEGANSHEVAKSLESHPNSTRSNTGRRKPGPSPSWQNGRRTLGNFLPDFESFTRKSETHQKKKCGKSENRLRRARLSSECTGNGDETGKESPTEKTNGDTFLGKTNQITHDLEEFKGWPDCKTDHRPENQTWKKSFSGIAASQSVDSVNVNPELNKDTRSRVNKGRGTLSKKDGTKPETVSKQTSESDQKTKFSNEIDNDKLIARAIEENAAVLSEFSLFEPSEKNKSLPGKNLSENTHKNKLGKTVRKPRLYEPDDSSDDDFLLYSKKTENELDCDGLPCQFCGRLYSPYTLMSHQQICNLNPGFDFFPRKKYNKKRIGQDEKEGAITCTICSQIVPFSRYSTHQIMHDTAAKN